MENADIPQNAAVEADSADKKRAWSVVGRSALDIATGVFGAAAAMIWWTRDRFGDLLSLAESFTGEDLSNIPSEVTFAILAILSFASARGLGYMAEKYQDRINRLMNRTRKN